MATAIKLTDADIAAIRGDFEAALSKLRASDGKISFTRTLNKVDKKAKIVFSEIAWYKMQAIIRENDKEVGWHGLVHRDIDSDEYYIYDIIIYPQIVTGVNIDPDQVEYQNWLVRQEHFEDIRMQGHSHVNMGTSPSSVDLNFYSEIISQLKDDMFYIFVIWNKRGEKTIKIYDFAKNVLFETADCTIEIANDGLGIQDIIAESKAMVKERSWYSNTGYSSTTKAATSQPAGGSSSQVAVGTNGSGSHSGACRKGKRKKGAGGSYFGAATPTISPDGNLSLYGGYDYYEW